MTLDATPDDGQLALAPLGLLGASPTATSAQCSRPARRELPMTGQPSTTRGGSTK